MELCRAVISWVNKGGEKNEWESKDGERNDREEGSKDSVEFDSVSDLWENEVGEMIDGVVPPCGELSLSSFVGFGG